MPILYINKPSEDTTVGSGDGSDKPSYGQSFGLISADGSGNPPDTENPNKKMRTFYDKDLDLVQNIRNVFAVVGTFKETLDNVIMTASYGGIVWMTGYIHPEERVSGVLYLGVHSVTDTGINNAGQSVQKLRIQAENYLGQVIAFNTDADIIYFDNSNSYELTSTSVFDAINELSNRSIIKSVIIPESSWRYVSSSNIRPVEYDEDPYVYAEVDFPGILETDYPIVTLAPMTAYPNELGEIAEAGHISRIETLNGKIKVYCYDNCAPSCDLRLVFRILRGGSPF